jgi:LacI family transcriptional regulator
MAAVTLTDVAVRAGVSQPTASRVLNGSARKPAPHVVEAVRRAAQELGYVPNAQAQALARSTTGLLGLVVHDISDPYFSTIASGVQRAAAARDRQMMLTATLLSPAHEVDAVEAFISHRTDAIIMVGSRRTTDEGAAAAERLDMDLARYTVNGGRVAVVGQAIPHAHAVIPDNIGGAAALADGLVGAGLRDFIVLCGPPELTTAADRTAGFLSAIGGHGLSPRGVIPGAFTRDGGYDAARAAIAGVSQGAGLAGAGSTRGISGPVCLFAANDVMALGAMTAMRELGISVPGEVQIAGFDDIPTLRDHSPSLTTVRLPLQAMGERAVELALAGPAGSDLQIESITGEVILRESTAVIVGSQAAGSSG